MYIAPVYKKNFRGAGGQSQSCVTITWSKCLPEIRLNKTVFFHLDLETDHHFLVELWCFVWFVRLKPCRRRRSCLYNISVLIVRHLCWRILLDAINQSIIQSCHSSWATFWLKVNLKNTKLICRLRHYFLQFCFAALFFVDFTSKKSTRMQLQVQKHNLFQKLAQLVSDFSATFRAGCRFKLSEDDDVTKTAMTSPSDDIIDDAVRALADDESSTPTAMKSSSHHGDFFDCVSSSYLLLLSLLFLSNACRFYLRSLFSPCNVFFIIKLRS